MSEQMYTNGEYLEKNPTWHIQDSPWKAKDVLKIIERNRLHLNSICEIGCGAGEILNQLYLRMPSNVSFMGYEISPQAFELCKERKKERLQYQLKDLLQEEKAFYDLVLAMDVFEHIENYYDFLRKLHKKGKYKIFRIPLDLSVTTVFQRCIHILRERQTVGHIHYFTKEIALAALTDTGYEVLDYFYTPCICYLRTESVKIKLKRLPIKMMFRFNKDATARFFGGYSLMVLAK